MGFNLADTNELFSAVLHAYLHVQFPNGFNVHDLCEDPAFIQLTRDELGVFKAELAHYAQAAQFISSLKKQESYLKKGERRQRAQKRATRKKATARARFAVSALSTRKEAPKTQAIAMTSISPP